MRVLTTPILVMWNYYQGWQSIRVRVKRFGRQRIILCGRCVHSEILPANRKEYAHLEIPEGKFNKCARCQALYVLEYKPRTRKDK